MIFKSLEDIKLRNFCLGLIYPAFWGFYLSCLRYLRMGLTIDFNYYLSYITPDIFVVFSFILIYIFPLLFNFILFCNQLRIILWDHTASLSYSIHLRLLRYYIYFRLCELIYKGHFVYHDVLSGCTGATTWDLKNTSFYRQWLSYIYYHPILITISVFFIVLIELFVFKGKLYYSLYILFFYPLIFSLFRCFSAFGFSDLILDVCLSDYVALNFTNPRYKSQFWLYISSPTFWFGFEHQYSPDLLDVLNRTILLESIARKYSTRFRMNILYRIWGRRYITMKEKPYSSSISTGYPKRWGIRLAGHYSYLKGVRWFHSNRVLYAPLPDKLHPLTLISQEILMHF
jgi:hypothetical protein